MKKGGAKLLADRKNLELIRKMIDYRARERISQKELANRVGVSVQTINSIENGLQEPSKLTEAKIYLVIDEKKEG